ncbi:hypothetical protein QVD17_31067 [Tagetes erecta]|uniref:Uncharacterized protein n=1 Tax=Tagetes erecta TaxID=13708 RepID=A0AAD8K3W8_TARER|nr:hypothetical protein QVD17_31067 [Tagetes erecta]
MIILTILKSEIILYSMILTSLNNLQRKLAGGWDQLHLDLAGAVHGLGKGNIVFVMVTRDAIVKLLYVSQRNDDHINI